jgi:hypothetical protein
VSVPLPDPSIAEALPASASGTLSDRHQAVVGRKVHPAPVAGLAGDALLLATLALFNESDDIDSTLQKCLSMLTTALGGRVAEIWLRNGDARQVELQYASSDGSAGVEAFEAEGRALGLGSGPALISRVVRTGRGSTATSSVSEGWGGRAPEAAAADIHSAMTFPIRARSGVIGVLVVYRESTGRPPGGVLAVVPTICHHMGRFLERVRAEGAIHESMGLLVFAFAMVALFITSALLRGVTFRPLPPPAPPEEP